MLTRLIKNIKVYTAIGIFISAFFIIILPIATLLYLIGWIIHKKSGE